MFLNPGDVIEGRYTIQKSLGGGGYATVYLAADQRLNTHVALKQLRITGTTPEAHQKLLARFEGEAQIAAKIKHRCSVEVSDYGTLSNTGQPFLVMEYIDGPTLAAHLNAHGAMSPKRIKKLWLGALEALAEAHAMGVVHRDLKPDNLMLADIGTRRERLVVLDFGIARRVHGADRKHSTTQGLLGTLAYMPPELLEDASSATPATDVFQVGLIISEMLAGAPCIPADSIGGVYKVYASDDWGVPEAQAQGPFGPLLERALRLEPEARYQDADALLEALEGVDLSPRKRPREAISPTPYAPVKSPAEVESAQGLVPTTVEASPIVEASAVGVGRGRDIGEVSGAESTIVVEPGLGAHTLEPGQSVNTRDLRQNTSERHKGTRLDFDGEEDEDTEIGRRKRGVVWVVLAGFMGMTLVLGVLVLSEDCSAGDGVVLETGVGPESNRDAKARSNTQPSEKSVEVKEQKKPDSPKPSKREGMVFVEAGEFTRGSRRLEDEKPVEKVWLDGFWIDTHEVTVEQYTECVEAGACSVPVMTVKDLGYYNWGSSGPRRSRLKHPINGVDWEQAKAFCAWKSKRLPTEAQWEKAARGVDGRTYPWGEAIPSCRYAVMDDDSADGCGKDRTWEVGSKPDGVSPYGAHDMAGNVHEWTADWYGVGYHASADGNGRNPMGPRLGLYRVVRGGGWCSHSFTLRASDRTPYARSHANFDLGFRCSGTTE